MSKFKKAIVVFVLLVFIALATGCNDTVREKVCDVKVGKCQLAYQACTVSSVTNPDLTIADCDQQFSDCCGDCNQ